MNDLITILVPLYNNHKYIKKCIKSILKQTYKNFELIIVDDGSTDDSYDIVNEFAKKDSRIRLFKKRNEKSVSKTRNFLLHKIHGKYFVFIDSDDHVSETYLEVLHKAIKLNNADISICGYTVQNMYLENSRRLKKFSSSNSEETIAKIVFNQNISCNLWNKMFKTSIIKDLKFDPNLNYGEDFIFLINLLQHNYKVNYVSNKLYRYRINFKGLSKGYLTDNKIYFLDLLKKISNDEAYSEETRKIIKSWIYVTSLFFIFLGNKQPQYTDYVNSLRNEVKQTYDSFDNESRISSLYRFYMFYIKIHCRVKLK
ncbi:MAG: glycosyltransferase family 2 protein [Acholeplasmatales bacterium]|nr:glycosyltransferase family 2 protein [Acholeplasmatales bacterium]